MNFSIIKKLNESWYTICLTHTDEDGVESGFEVGFGKEQIMDLKYELEVVDGKLIHRDGNQN